MQAGNSGGIRNDPFVMKMMERIPANEQDSFSDTQLESLKVAFGARTWGVHPVDLRWTLKFWRKRYYFVFISGVNRRPLSRRQQELARSGKTLLFAIVLLVSTLVGGVILYLIKSAVGINIFSNYSFGLWTWFKANIL